MGLIKAAMGAVDGVLADQWKEFFYCDALDADTLVAKGMKRTSSRGRSSNTSGEDNIISNGSVISVNNGQCMIIVEQGKVVEICAEPGEYTYDKSTEPTVFEGDLGTSLMEVFKQMGKRFTFGGDTGKDQRVYYFNTKEIIGNKYGTPQPIPFRITDASLGLNAVVSIRCFGEYSYRLVNPILFYTNVCGNVEGTYSRSEIDSQLKTELLTALQPAFAQISSQGIRYDELPGHTMEIADALNSVLGRQWGERRGIEVVSFGVSSVTANPEDEKRLKDLQFSTPLTNPAMAAARIAGAQAQAMQDAARNEGGMGAMGAFMGMGMAQNAGGINAGQLFQMAGQQAQPQAAPPPSPAAGGWTCSCGHAGNTGKFCSECGKPQPAPASAWTCSCGHAGNTGKFCAECGKPKPAGPWTCSCGTQNEGKFCSNCGKPRQ
ncbi:MAG: SPFH domain-containing protein [Selenomonadaceae bacterium]|nr:SPFH domain-containing protein [Selenomonadaceae bacterium]MBQ1915223.1 SPFH domain-containing protein [Selenomonadaceae bacterium]